MFKRLSARNAALLYGTVTCLLWALVPTLLFPNPPLDVVEGFAWGRELALGYTKHPPMQAWLLEATYRLTGGHVFGGYWLSAACVGLSYIAIWKLARRLRISPAGALWSILLTSITFYFTQPLPEFNPNILQIPVWAWMILLFHQALANGKKTDWLLLGAVAAFGLYTKYFVALLVGAIGLYVLVFPRARRCLLTAGPWLAALTCVILLIPHIWWLFQTDFLTLQYAASRSKTAVGILDHILNPLSFFGAQLGNHAALILAVLVGLGVAGLKHRNDPATPALPKDLQSKVFVLWFAFLPLSVLLLAGLSTGNEFEHMWGTPMFVLSGLAAVYLLDLPKRFRHQKAALSLVVLVQATFIVLAIGQATLEPRWKAKQTRMHYPGEAVALALSQAWKNEMGSELRYIAGDMWSAANVTIHAPERPSMFYLHDVELSPWINLSDVQNKGLMIVWRGTNDQPLAELLRFYPNARRQSSIDIDYAGNGIIPPVTVNWLIIPPGSVAVEPMAN
ncbi:glycosyltransferase family 39 protein [Roseibium hamelinense]|nr:glycosyltransferase family 39 protein [Roseibium hamelinense]MTI42867.1 glycosyltransferase family 39 protein [Roseibium hamelinense]